MTTFQADQATRTALPASNLQASGFSCQTVVTAVPVPTIASRQIHCGYSWMRSSSRKPQLRCRCNGQKSYLLVTGTLPNLDLDHLPISEGRVILIRQVSGRGKITLLGQTFKVGQSHKFNYVKVVLDTRRQRLTVYVTGKVLKRWAYKLNRR